MPDAPLGAIWDMDGTLVDTAELHFAAWEAVCRSRGRDFTREDFAATFGQRNPEIIRKLFGNDYDEEGIAAFGEEKEVQYREAARRAAGIRQAIGSSAPRKNLELIRELTGVGDYFSAIVGAEETQRGKPDPQVFQVAAGKLGVPPGRCVVFEDAVPGVQAARAGGMKCVAVRFAGHHAEDALRAAGADIVVGSLEKVSVGQVLGLLLG
jgi:beta-phosphoglucomutase